MAMPVVNGAMCSCTFGVAPCPLMATSQQQALAVNMPVASMANPTVASATAAALGVLTPMPCTPVPAGVWAPGSPTVLVGGKPALNNTSKLMCAYGGVISVTMSPASTVNVP